MLQHAVNDKCGVDAKYVCSFFCGEGKIEGEEIMGGVELCEEGGDGCFCAVDGKSDVAC